MSPVSGLRGQGSNLPANPESIGIPTRVFLFTFDQISIMLNVEERLIRRDYVHYQGRSVGTAKRSLLIARNIAPDDAPPDWRVAEREFIRWMRHKGFKYYDRGSIVV